MVARHRAQAAADLAALAAAEQLGAGLDAACARAGSIATRMHGSVAECAIDGLDVVLRVEVAAALGRWGVGRASAAARAGPA
ncbi:hypothetical protein GCM10023114_24990 [Mycolicibacterium sediminis]|uniref:Uncharacterized protein n=1 Tax=Mycolicibacterium sediminis TaxID=1286180 RepID=A0A7I7QJL1_9MYCO|nr:hypothetical protein MSEDJ_03530 [Mycolicibacterium sediminis]